MVWLLLLCKWWDVFCSWPCTIQLHAVYYSCTVQWCKSSNLNRSGHKVRLFKKHRHYSAGRSHQYIFKPNRVPNREIWSIVFRQFHYFIGHANDPGICPQRLHLKHCTSGHSVMRCGPPHFLHTSCWELDESRLILRRATFFARFGWGLGQSIESHEQNWVAQEEPSPW